jgi:FG-GAP-like repeat/ASPIC and UnbV
MRFALRVVLVGIACLTVAGGAVAWITGFDGWGKGLWSLSGASKVGSASADISTGSTPEPNSKVEVFPDPNAPGTRAYVFVDRGSFDGDIAPTAFAYTGSIRDPRSLDELRQAFRGRGRRGLTAFRAEYDRLHFDSPPTFEQAFRGIPLARSIAFLYMHDGKFGEASSWLERALEMSHGPNFSPDIAAGLHALLGIVAFRKGEIENCLECVGPSSCIFPIESEAVHRQQTGSRMAVKEFTAYLSSSPGDLRIRWLLNLAYMTLGEYPDKVPSQFLIPLDRFRSELDVGRFENVAPLVGLGIRGPNLAGGSIFDDLDGDGLIDLLTTAIDTDLGGSLFINRGDGTFEDRTASAGLGQQVCALNVARGDYDNDGYPDILLMRGAWERPARLSLLRNKKGGIFEDVTVASGLDDPIATESAVWGDYDNDGRLDLFVCGEFFRDTPDPTTRCRLYHNQGDGTFKNVADEAGIVNEYVAKGSAWGDYDDDGWLDLFVSNHDGPCRLYHNDGNGKFRDVAQEMGITSPSYAKSFACWFWDYDNDGRLDLFVNDYDCVLADVVADYLRLKKKAPSHPRLYKNVGKQGFREVSQDVGLNRPISAMGANFGDIDNDGFLDAYFGTGQMAYSGLVPNVMLKNVEGRRFEDVTDSSRTGHLQKGHGVSFADWDCDGDLDLFVELGGAYPGDQAYNVLFQNPGHGRHWLKVKLVGTKTNRSAIGARIHVDLKLAGDQVRSIHRTIGNNGSFGGNPLLETIGLGDVARVATLQLYWPTSKITQTFHDLAADQAIEVTEGVDKYRVMQQRKLKIPNP